MYKCTVLQSFFTSKDNPLITTTAAPKCAGGWAEADNTCYKVNFQRFSNIFMKTVFL